MLVVIIVKYDYGASHDTNMVFMGIGAGDGFVSVVHV